MADESTFVASENAGRIANLDRGKNSFRTTLSPAWERAG
jgi:hypothetical protein